MPRWMNPSEELPGDCAAVDERDAMREVLRRV